MQGSIQFYKGEKKYVSCEVTPRNENEIVVILQASYELRSARTKELIESGLCTIDGTTVQVLLSMDERGSFLIMFTVSVGAEIVKGSAIIDVV